MTRNLVHMLDHLELPAPVTVGMILVVAALAKGGHLFWAIAGMVALHTLFIVARLSSARFKKHRVEMETAPAANRANLSLVPTEVVKSSILESPVLAREPQRSAAPPPPLRKVA